MPGTDTTTKEKVIEGEYKEEGANGERRVARIEPPQPQELAQWSPTFEAAAVDRAVVQVQEKRRFFDRVMTSGEHYAIIPGQRPTPKIDQATGQPMKDGQGNAITVPPKPALLKPGAELLLSSMSLHPELVDEIIDEDWTGEKHGGEPFFRYRRRANIWRQTGPGPEDRMLIASASGECNSWEEKYRFRGAGRSCPECKAEATIIKGNPQYAPRENGRSGPVIAGFEKGGFLCWKKKGGCGAQFGDLDPRIVNQDETKAKHPNPADLTNTILKMADKRALVAATLLATGCSDLFTQDIQDIEDKAEKGENGAAPASASGSETASTEAAKDGSTPSAGPAPTIPPMSDKDHHDIAAAYRWYQEASIKGPAGPAKELAGKVVRAWGEFMKKHTTVPGQSLKWTGLWADARLVPEARKVLGIEEAPPAPPAAPEPAAPAEPVASGSFDPDEVPS